eukprot:scaffold11636_cov62-Cyclotella_meneghiniana.AAC.4
MSDFARIKFKLGESYMAAAGKRLVEVVRVNWLLELVLFASYTRLVLDLVYLRLDLVCPRSGARYPPVLHYFITFIISCALDGLMSQPPRATGNAKNGKTITANPYVHLHNSVMMAPVPAISTPTTADLNR